MAAIDPTTLANCLGVYYADDVSSITLGTDNRVTAWAPQTGGASGSTITLSTVTPNNPDSFLSGVDTVNGMNVITATGTNNSRMEQSAGFPGVQQNDIGVFMVIVPTDVVSNLQLLRDVTGTYAPLRMNLNAGAYGVGGEGQNTPASPVLNADEPYVLSNHSGNGIGDTAGCGGR